MIFRLKSLNSKEDLEVISDIGNGLGFRRRNMQAMHPSRFI
jgi:predicted site-specific integrase-resolvase